MGTTSQPGNLTSFLTLSFFMYGDGQTKSNTTPAHSCSAIAEKYASLHSEE